MLIIFLNQRVFLFPLVKENASLLLVTAIKVNKLSPLLQRNEGFHFYLPRETRREKPSQPLGSGSERLPFRQLHPGAGGGFLLKGH